MSSAERLIGKYDVPAKLQTRLHVRADPVVHHDGAHNQRIPEVEAALRGDRPPRRSTTTSSRCLLALPKGLARVRPRDPLPPCRGLPGQGATLLAGGKELCREVYLLVRGVLPPASAASRRTRPARTASGRQGQDALPRHREDGLARRHARPLRKGRIPLRGLQRGGGEAGAA